MGFCYARIVSTGALLLALPLTFTSVAYAAKPIDLSQQKVSVLQSFIKPSVAMQGTTLQETRRSVDFNNTLHVRVQEMYSGYPVWGADAVVHVPNGDAKSSLMSAANNTATQMNGVVYQNIEADLANTPANVLSDAQAKKALEKVVTDYDKEVGVHSKIMNPEHQLIVYVDDDHKAHWAYKVAFDAPPAKDSQLPTRPVSIVDAATFKVYARWDDIKTLAKKKDLPDALAGGYGGNKKMGQLTYDGGTGNLPALVVKRDDGKQMCYFRNQDVVVKKCTQFDSYFMRCWQSDIASNRCDAKNPDHNNVYWNGDFDAVNEGYSPTHDALFNGAVIKDLYKKWYNMDVLVKDGKPMTLNMVVHLNPLDNAYWDGNAMHFGDGISVFYPLVSLGVAAHEMSHGFTQQHSNLVYRSQSGGMNEAFSDMAAQAAEYFAFNTNSWQIGPEIFKQKGRALRYLDKPSKDCAMRSPCSIDHVDQYKEGLNVHLSSGVFNRAFYLLGTTPGWNTKKAFDVMVKANTDYWTSGSTFKEGACGVVKATRDYNTKIPNGGYDVDAAIKAFAAVGISTVSC